MLATPSTSRLTFYSADAAHGLSAAVEALCKAALEPQEACAVPASLLLQLTALPLPLAALPTQGMAPSLPAELLGLQHRVGFVWLAQ